MKIKKKKRKERKSIGNMIYIYNETSDWSSNKNRKLIRSQSSNKRLPRNGFLRKIKKKKEENKKKKKKSFAWIRACVHFRNVSRVVCTLNDVVYCAVQSVDCAWIEDSLAPCWTIEILKENGCRYNRGYNTATDCSSLSLVFLETFCARTKSNYAKI